jgi:hypothetical protein
MTGTLSAMAATFGMGIAYFLGAIPLGVSLNLHPVAAALSAWAGYTAIGAVMLALGRPARLTIERRFKISPEPDPAKLLWRVWGRYGMPGLGLLAPVTCGPYIAALLALALGEKPGRVLLWIAGGCLPWVIVFTVLAALGVNFLGK